MGGGKGGGWQGWGVGGGGSHEVAGPSDQKDPYGHMVSIQAVFSL